MHICFCMSKHDFATDCVMHNLRSAAREVTRRYEEHLRRHDLTGGQFSTLAALSQHPGLTLGRLAGALAMDRTTLTRNLKPLIGRGLIADAPDKEDGRIRRLALTEAGKAALARALPDWTVAQEESRKRLGAGDWADLRRTLRQL